MSQPPPTQTPGPFPTATIDGRQVAVLPIEELPEQLRRSLERYPKELWPSLRAVLCHASAQQQRTRVRPFYLCRCTSRGQQEVMPLEALPQGILDFFQKLPPKHWAQAVALLARPEESQLLVTFATLFDILEREGGDNGFGSGLVSMGERLTKDQLFARYQLLENFGDAIKRVADCLIALAHELQNEKAWNIIWGEFPPKLKPSSRHLPRKRQTSLRLIKPKPPALPERNPARRREHDARVDDGAPATLPASASVPEPPASEVAEEVAELLEQPLGEDDAA